MLCPDLCLPTMLKHISMTACSTLVSAFLACGVTYACPWKYDACLVMLKSTAACLFQHLSNVLFACEGCGQRVFCRCPAQGPQRGALHNTGLERTEAGRRTCEPRAQRWRAGRQRRPRRVMQLRFRRGCDSRPECGCPSHPAHMPPHPAAAHISHHSWPHTCQCFRLMQWPHMTNLHATSQDNSIFPFFKVLIFNMTGRRVEACDSLEHWR